MSSSVTFNGYQPLSLPVWKSFEKMDEKEAANYFNWFLGHVDERSDYLIQRVSATLCISANELNFSLQSLIPIWHWFLSAVEVCETPKNVLNKMQKKIGRRNYEFANDMIRANSIELSPLSRYVIRDIGMYVGKMFVNNYNVLRWDYHTNIKQDSFANIPQVFGFINCAYTPPFEMQFDPIHYVEMTASNIFDNTETKLDLYNTCKKWLQWIPTSMIE